MFLEDKQPDKGWVGEEVVYKFFPAARLLPPTNHMHIRWPSPGGCEGRLWTRIRVLLVLLFPIFPSYFFVSHSYMGPVLKAIDRLYTLRSKGNVHRHPDAHTDLVRWWRWWTVGILLSTVAFTSRQTAGWLRPPYGKWPTAWTSA